MEDRNEYVEQTWKSELAAQLSPARKDNPYSFYNTRHSHERPAAYRPALKTVAYDAPHSMPTIPASTSLADKIFGRQLLAGSLSIEDLRLAVDRRRHLRTSHLEELTEWRNDLLNRISFARRPYSGATPQTTSQLERMQLQIELARQKEELSYWEDMAELYKEILEQTIESQATRERYEMLGGLRPGDG